MSIGEKIQEYRKKAGLTQQRLAECAGVATITIRQYESGKRQPRVGQLQKIANALGVSVSELIGFPIEEETMERFMREPKYAVAFETDEHIGIKSRATMVRYRKNFLLYQKQSEQLATAFKKLNDEGRTEAVKRVEELTEISRYQKKDEPGQK